MVSLLTLDATLRGEGEGVGRGGKVVKVLGVMSVRDKLP